MHSVKTWFVKFNGSPLRFKLEMWFWVIVIPTAFVTGLINSVAFVSFLSLYALVLTLAGAVQAAEARIEASEGNPTPEQISEHLVAHTSLEKE